MIECWFDGGCGPINPGGHATYGALIKQDGVEVWTKSGYLGFGPEMSNNVAEYAGIIAVMEKLLDKGITNATIYGDSKLVVRQMMGSWKAKAGLYVPFYQEAIKLRRRLPNVVIKHIRRQFNTRADYLAWQARPVKGKQTRAKELTKLVREQRADANRDKYGPRAVRVIKRSDPIRESNADLRYAIDNELRKD